ncbi:MAG TPA: neutral/alkaline non-lysosomal ceramidase N-terminal domain-containing protein [Tepidisphaeraceae bacterium]|jgi:putative membrane-bound dehydrogenase-like protein
MNHRLLGALAMLVWSSAVWAADYQVGLARVDITPDYPVRLNGFGNRRSESEGVTQKIFAKAIAIVDESKSPAILMAVDSLGVPDYMTSEVARRLKAKAQIDPARLAITSTHTHTAPALTNCCPTIFGEPIPPAHQQHIDEYTKQLTDKLEEVALAALKELKPAKLGWGSGRVEFAINRRTPGGPVDHEMPLLAVRDLEGNLIAINVSYACHCVTLSHNKISGDWAGYAAEIIEKAHPGALALTSIGCGADANPSTYVKGDRPDIAEAQGKQIADEVERLLRMGLSPIKRPISAKVNRIALPFDTLPTREQWEATAKLNDASGYHARVNLAKLDRGEKLQTELSYPIQTWSFGTELAMVFLPGEVVVDYSLRLKREFDRTRLWVNSYSNDVPCYIPSERILREGGYEGIAAMFYYDRPTKLASGIEQKIIDEVHRQLPEHFVAPKGTEGIAPRTPERSLQSIRTKPGLKVELVASEPLIQSPVAIDWGADGRLWVCQMYDYPTGTDGNFLPGGRLKFLTDTDGDGRFDRATVFAENLPFPTGVMEYGDGVFICAAPDILFARDTNHDGKADEIRKVFSGFATENYQTRVNSLAIGLDNWIYGANGLLTGVVTDSKGQKLDLRNHDFRFRPVDGPMEVVTGLTQYGRVRDDFGHWFGCDNTRPLLHFPIEQRYLARNPHAPSPAGEVAPAGDYDVGRVYPVSRTLERFNDPDFANRFTSACGIAIYRDTLLGEDLYGNAFTCEPVHNLVHRVILEGEGSSLKRHRAADERESEFFASGDNWTRPVQARTGPDGALYVVDMYRFLIEHPRWIPAERLAQIDVRAGSDKGRIYRVVPEHGVRPVRDLSKLSAEDLAAALDASSGTERDRVHVALLARNDKAAAAALEKIAATAKLPQVRVQALTVLEGLKSLKPDVVDQALRDENAQVRAHAVRLMERESSPRDAVLALANDPSPTVRKQLAFSLGEWGDSRAGKTLAAMTKASLADAEMRVAILSSAKQHCGEILAAVMSAGEDAAGRAEWIGPLVATAVASKDDELAKAALAAVLPAEGVKPAASHFASLGSLLDARPDLIRSNPPIANTIAAARDVAKDVTASAEARTAALGLLGRGEASGDELDALCEITATEASDDLRGAALTALRRQQSPEVAKGLLARWAKIPPGRRADIVNLLLGREQWSTALLEAMKKRQVQPNEIALAERSRLTENASETVRKLAAEAFASQPISASRAQVLSRYATVKTLTGSAPAGKELFTRNCAACHLHNGVGNDIGAPLAALRGRDADYLVKQILNPSAIVEPRFVNYVVTLKDGRTLSGIIKAETPASITLASGGATAASTEAIARAKIKEIRATSVSMMPDGFEAALPPQQMADVIAFIKSGSTPRKQLPGNAPAMVAVAKDGSLMLPATQAEIYGEHILFESQFANIGYWDGGGDYAVWTMKVEKPGTFDVHLDYACEQRAAGNTFSVEAAGQTITGAVAGTGADWSNYQQVKVGTLQLAAGEHRLTVRPEAPPRTALMDLRTVALVPQGTQPKWPLPAAASSAAAAAVKPSDDLPRDAAGVARYILDAGRSSAAREAAVNANPQYAAELIAEMTRDLAPATPAEYERIPWIWRVAIASGKRNDAEMLKRMLDVSLPRDEAPLHDWQAVVIGGGIINGISQRDLWPAQRLAEVIGDDPALQKRWRRALDLASAMAENAKTPPGTRYDALRMLGAEPWEKRGKQLAKYLAKDANPELQMGAVSGLGDVDSPDAAAALREALPQLTEENRKLAEKALKRHAR